MELLTVPEVAKILRVPAQRVYELTRAGMLPIVNIGKTIRISKSALEDWINKGGDNTSTRKGPQ